MPSLSTSTATTQADGTAGGTQPDPNTGPTVTFYQQLADQFMKELDGIAAIIPQLEASHISTVNFVRSHVTIPNAFLATAIHTVEQTPLLQGLKKLDVAAGRDTLQFLEAFRPVLDKVTAFASALQFTISSRKASLAADALQIYDIAKGVSRDPGSAELASRVANLKRDLGRRGRPRISAAARKAKLTGTTTPVPEVKKSA
jgi:hypothetical protein